MITGFAGYDSPTSSNWISMEVRRYPMRTNYEVIVIGGGQAGLATGYYLSQQGIDFVILDAGGRIGDQWRSRWDSLRLFTPAKFDGLPGMLFPGPAFTFPTKDEFGDYLENYAAHFNLPVKSGITVKRLSQENGRFIVQADDLRLDARQVVVAMANYQKPKMPGFANQLDPGILQLHSSQYRNPGQLQEGGVLIVGAGNSGAEIAVEVGRSHPTWLSGRSTGNIPFRIQGAASRLFLARLMLRFLFHKVLTLDTPIGRKIRPQVLARGGPLIRVMERDLLAAGIERVPRTTGVRDGLPLLSDGGVLQVANLIWCTGYEPGFDWIDLPVLSKEEPGHERGVVPQVPGLYFTGLHFLYALSSAMIHGAGRDARYIAGQIVVRAKRDQPVTTSEHNRPDAVLLGK
jgi:putative flavoprotein involved in K+ transport